MTKVLLKILCPTNSWTEGSYEAHRVLETSASPALLQVVVSDYKIRELLTSEYVSVQKVKCFLEGLAPDAMMLFEKAMDLPESWWAEPSIAFEMESFDDLFDIWLALMSIKYPELSGEFVTSSLSSYYRKYKPSPEMDVDVNMSDDPLYLEDRPAQAHNDGLYHCEFFVPAV